MRILILIDRFLPEERANAQLYYELARGLVGRGHEVGVVTKMPSGYVPTGPGNHSVRRPPAQERLDGIDVIRIQGLSSLSRALWIRAADQLMAGVTFTLAARRWRGADIVLIYSPPLTLAVAGWLYQKWLGARYVLNLHDIYPQTLIDLGLLKNRVLIRLAEALEAMAYRKAARIVVPFPKSREFLAGRKGIRPTRTAYIPNWVDTERVLPGSKENGFRKAHGLTGRFVVTYAGSMGYGQDLTPVLAGARALQPREEIVFVLVGDGVCKKKWEQEGRELANVRIFPMQPKGRYLEILRASDVCLVPLSEALSSPAIPGKTQDIMAVARPLIAIVQPESATAELVKQSACGLVVRPGRTEELVQAIDCLFRDAEMRERLGANGRRYTERYFSLRFAVQEYERVFETVLQQQ